MPEATRLEASGGSRLDDATVFGPYVVDRARIASGHGDVEARASIASVLHPPIARRLGVELGIDLEQALAHPRFVLFEEVHGARPVVAAATACDAVSPVRIGIGGIRIGIRGQ